MRSHSSWILGRRHQSLDAMALLALREGGTRLRHVSRLAADAAHESRGQAGRRPAAARIRGEIDRLLDAALGAGWRSHADAVQAPLGEQEACDRALGLRTDA